MSAAPSSVPSAVPPREPSAVAAPRVVLYGRAGCHLCDEARAVVEAVCAQAGEAFVERDVDADPALVATYGDLVPVVTVDGVQQGFWRVDADHLRAALRG